MPTPRDPDDLVSDRLRRLCERAVESLPVSGAGLSIVTDKKHLSLIAAADPVSERLEELQFVLGEGPCVEAASAGRPVLVADLDVQGRRRWPIYTAAAQEAGMAAVFAFPLRVGAARLGVLDLFRTRSGPLSGPALDRAYAENRRLVDVARAVVARELSFERDEKSP